MKLKEIIREFVDYTPKPQKHNKEITIPKLTDKWDYGSASNNVKLGDVVIKSSGPDHNVYGRRPIKQRALKKRK